jgi:hypothetical protein
VLHPPISPANSPENAQGDGIDRRSTLGPFERAAVFVVAGGSRRAGRSPALHKHLRYDVRRVEGVVE